MKSIVNYTIQNTPSQTLTMSQGAKILGIQLHYNQPTLFVLVDSEQPAVNRNISVHSTDPVPDGEVYIGTYQLTNGAVVLHVFDGGEA